MHRTISELQELIDTLIERENYAMAAALAARLSDKLKSMAEDEYFS